jgi:hypothetical protein
MYIYCKYVYSKNNEVYMLHNQNGHRNFSDTSLEAFAGTEFNEILSGGQPRLEDKLRPHLQAVLVVW